MQQHTSSFGHSVAAAALIDSSPFSAANEKEQIYQKVMKGMSSHSGIFSSQ
jgi:hypothetical protein